MEGSRPAGQDGNTQREFLPVPAWERTTEGKKRGREASRNRRLLRALKVQAPEGALRHQGWCGGFETRVDRVLRVTGLAGGVPWDKLRGWGGGPPTAHTNPPPPAV